MRQADSGQLDLQTLRDDQFDEVTNAVAVTPFVVVPADQLEELAVQFNTAPFVEDRRRLAVDKVAAHDFVFGVFQDTLQVGFAGLLHRGGDFGVAGFLRGLHGQVDDRDGRYRNAQSHAGQLALHFGADQSHSLRSAGGDGDDALSGSTATLPVLLARAVDRLLGRGISMNGGHQTFVDAEFLQQDVNDGGQAVRRARSVRDDVVLGSIILVAVDAHHDGDVFTLRWGRDDDLLRTGGDVTLGLFGFGEQAGLFDDDVDAELLPGKFGWRLGTDDVDVVAIDDQNIILSLVWAGFL